MSREIDGTEDLDAHCSNCEERFDSCGGEFTFCEECSCDNCGDRLPVKGLAACQVCIDEQRSDHAREREDEV